MQREQLKFEVERKNEPGICMTDRMTYYPVNFKTVDRFCIGNARRIIKVCSSRLLDTSSHAVTIHRSSSMDIVLRPGRVDEEAIKRGRLSPDLNEPL